MVVLFRLKLQFLQFYNLNLQANIIHLKKKKSSIPYFFDFQILSQENGWKFRKTFGQSFYCQELPDYKVVWDNRSLGEL